MALFPASPTNGQTTVVNGITYTYNSAQTAWIRTSTIPSGDLNVTGNVIATGNISGVRLISNVATGTAPLTVSSTTLVANLNADLLEGYNPAAANTASTIALRDANGNLSANFFTGNGSQLTGIITSVSNVSNGNSNLNIPSANGNVNISAVGNANIVVVTGTGVNVAGTLNTGSGVITGNGNGLSSLQASNVTGTLPAAVTNAISNVGTITAGTWNSTFTAGLNANTLANIQGGNVSGAVASATAATNASALLQNTSTATTVYPTFTTSSANGNSSAVINTGISANLGNSSITATTFVGALSGAATTAGTVTTAAQPNITSVGTLTSLAVTGNATVGNLQTGGGTGGNISGANVISANVFTSTVATGTAPLVVSSTTQVANLNVATAGTAGSATTAGTVTTAAQPNITSVGTLTGLTVGNATANAVFGNGTITLNSGLITGNGNGLSSLQAGNVTGTLPTSVTNAISNVGTITAGTWNSTFTAGLNANTLANIQGGNVSGAVASATAATNASALLQNTSTATTVYPTFTTSSANGNSSAVINTGISANLGNSSITATTFVGALSGAATSATTAGTVTTAAQPNITSVGTLTALAVTGNVTAGNANVTGQLISTVTTGTAPLVVSSTTLVANLNADQLEGYNPASANTASTIALRDASGNLAANFFIGNGSQLTGLTVSSTTQIANGNSNVNIPAANGNINFSAAGNANVLVVTGSNVQMGSGSGGNITGANLVSANFFTGTLTTAAQPNITSVGTLTSLGVTGNLTAGNLIGPHANGNSNINIPAANGNINFSAAGNANVLVVTGSNVQVGTGSGGNITGANLISANVFSGNFTGVFSNGTSNIEIPTQSGNINFNVNGTVNDLVITDTGVNIAGTLNVVGNANAGNFGTTTAIITTGNITTINSGLLQNGTSNVVVTAAGGNVTLGVAGTARITATTTGGNVNGTFGVSGNANAGNFGTTTAIITTGNITTVNGNVANASTIIANAANGVVFANSITTSGAASGIVNVAATLGNLGFRSVAATYTDTAATGTQANAAIHYLATPTITGGTNAKTYTNMATFFIAGNVTASTNATITNNYAMFVAGGNSFFGGNIIGTLANGNSSVNIPLANGNVNIAAVGNTTLIVTGTGVNVSGTLNATGNANAGNFGTAGLIVATGNVTGSNIISTTNHLFSVATGISAAGSTQATGTAISKDFNVVSTVLSGNGVTLPTAVAGMRITVINTSANALNVYPLGNGIINSAAANAAYSQPAGARLDFICTAAATAPGGQWYTLNATYG